MISFALHRDLRLLIAVLRRASWQRRIARVSVIWPTAAVALRYRSSLLPEARVEEHSLVPLGKARLGRIGFDEWLRRSQAGA